MVVSGKLAGKTGTVVDIDTTVYPEIAAILDIDRRKDPESMYTYFSLRNVIEV